jgi:predicted RNA-binding protein with PUA domain
MMNECIKRSDAIDACFNGWNNNAHDCAENIRSIPAADVRPVVKAKWKHVQWVVDEEWQEGGYWISRCSNCSMPYHTETPFCPHCGSDMREEN